MPATLESNLREILDSLALAARDVGRDPASVSLLAVTKSVGPRTAEELLGLGVTDLGESRADSLLHKRAALATTKHPVTWHFIGHVQRNKARKVVLNSEVIHSVDSLRLIDSLERIAAEEGRRPRIFLEVGLSGDPQRHGFEPGEVQDAVLQAGQAPHLDLIGLMAMAPLPAPGEDPESHARPAFETLAELAEACRRKSHLADCFEDGTVRLSMGMSGDFRTAIACGSDVVRIGTALYRGLPADDSMEGVNG